MTAQVVIVSIIASFGIVLNSLVIVSLLNQWSKIKLRHILLVSLAFSDILTSLIGFPMELSGNRGIICRVSGYLVSSFGLVAIAHIVALCIERTITMRFPLKSTVFFATKTKSLMFVLPSWMYGMLWGTFPWFGWGGYAVESFSRHRCSIDLSTQSTNFRSYNYSLLVFCYIIPIVVVLFCFVIIKKEMRKMVKFAESVTGKKSKNAKASARSEKMFTFVVIVMLIAFMLAWTPYTMCVFYLTVHETISSKVLDAAAYLGKSSTLFNPIIYVYMYKEFRGALFRLFNIRPNQVDAGTSGYGITYWSNNKKSGTGADKSVTRTSHANEGGDGGNDQGTIEV